MTLRRVFDSVVTRLLLLSLGLVIMGAMLRIHALTRFLHQDLGVVVEEQQLAMANYVAHDIDDRIQMRLSVLDRMARDLSDAPLQPLRARQAWLQAHYRYQSLFSAGLLLLGRHGEPLAAYPAQTEHLDATPLPDYVRAGLRGSQAVGRPLPSTRLGALLPFASPVRDAQHRVVAVLVAYCAFNTPGFFDMLRQTRMGEQGGFLLVSPRDHLIIAASQQELALKATPRAGGNLLFDRAMAGFRGAGINVSANGDEEVAAMASVPSSGWFVVARLPGSEAFATMARVRNFSIKYAALVVVLFSLLASGLLYLVLRPLFRSARVADLMTQGVLPLKPLPIVRQDELGHLLAAFNRLLGKLNQQQAELERMAHHDTLTGLPNRSLLADRLQQGLSLARRRGTRLGLLFMDLNGFKQINDTLGHDAGDETLRQVALRLSAIVREPDTLARIGGDEFVLLLNDLEGDGEEAACIVAARCIEVLRQPVSLPVGDCQVGVSIGIALGHGGHSADDFLLAADKAMYQAKRSAQGGWVTLLL